MTTRTIFVLLRWFWMLLHKETLTIHRRAGELSCPMRESISHRSDWGNIVSRLFCTFFPRHRDCSNNQFQWLGRSGSEQPKLYSVHSTVAMNAKTQLSWDIYATLGIIMAVKLKLVIKAAMTSDIYMICLTNQSAPGLYAMPKGIYWDKCHAIIKTPWVTGELIVFGPFPPSPPSPPPPFCQPVSTFWDSPWTWLTYGCGEFFGTHLGDLGSMSLSYRRGTKFIISPR